MVDFLCQWLICMLIFLFWIHVKSKHSNVVRCFSAYTQPVMYSWKYSFNYESCASCLYWAGFVFVQAEKDLRIAQAEFDRQAEITKLLLEGITSTHVRRPLTPLLRVLVIMFSYSTKNNGSVFCRLTTCAACKTSSRLKRHTTLSVTSTWKTCNCSSAAAGDLRVTNDNVTYKFSCS